LQIDILKRLGLDVKTDTKLEIGQSVNILNERKDKNSQKEKLEKEE